MARIPKSLYQASSFQETHNICCRNSLRENGLKITKCVCFKKGKLQMLVNMLVLDDRQDKRKDGSVHRVLALADLSRPALTHTLIYAPREDDLTKLPPEGKAVDHEVEIAIRGIKWNNFQLAQEIALGTIVSCKGLNGSAAGKKAPGASSAVGN